MLLSSNVLCAAPLSSTSTFIDPLPFVITCRPLARLRRNVDPSTSAVMLPPSACSSSPSFPGETVSVSRNVLSVTSSCESVPEALTIRALSSGELATSVRVIAPVPARSVKWSPASSVAASSPLLSTTLSATAKFVTPSPRMPLPRLSRSFMRVSETPRVAVRATAFPVVLWIVPPVQASPVVAHAPPLPVTVRPPVLPVPVSTMPFAAPLAATRWKVTPAAAMAVLATVSAVPVPVSAVFPVPLT